MAGFTWVNPITCSQDIVDVLRHAMEALEDEPKHPADDNILIREELLSVLDFFGEG